MPYKWSVLSGALPGGLTIGNDGSVSGTPTTAGTFSFTIQVTDATSSTASLPAASMAIAPAVTLGLIASCAQYCRVELGCDSSCGAFGQVGGGAGPYNYSFGGGQLPAGTSLNGLTLKGTFKGQSGWVQFTVQVTDAFGGTAAVSPKFWMYDHIAWSGTYPCFGSYPTACSVQIPFTGGVPGGQPQLTLASVGAYCPPNYPVCPPPPANAPNGITNMTTVVGPNGGGTVTFTVAADCGGGLGGCPNGYNGAIGLVLVDQAVCGSNMRCQTGAATVDVHMVGG